MNINKRALLVGVSSLFIAPAIVRASSLMPIKVVDTNIQELVIAFKWGDKGYINSCFNNLKQLESTGLVLSDFEKGLLSLSVQEQVVALSVKDEHQRYKVLPKHTLLYPGNISNDYMYIRELLQ